MKRKTPKKPQKPTRARAKGPAPTRRAAPERFVPVLGCVLCDTGLRKRHDHVIREPASAAAPAPVPAAPPAPVTESDALTPRQRRFVLEYLADLNATRAAMRAGYSPRTCNEQGSQLLANLSVRAAVDAALEERAERLKLKADDILRELLRIGLADPARAISEDGGLLPLHEMPEDVRRAVAGIEVEELFEGRGREREHVGTLRKVKFWPKHEALRDLGRHLKLFTDQVEARVLDSLTDEERAKRLDAIMAAAQARRAAAPPPREDAGADGDQG